MSSFNSKNKIHLHTFVIPLVKPKKFLASHVSTLDVPYITYLPLNFNRLRPRSQSSPAIQSKIRSTPSGANLNLVSFVTIKKNVLFSLTYLRTSFV